MRFFVFPTCFQPLFFRGMKKGSNDREMGRFRFWWLPCPRKKYSFLIITFFRRDEKCVSYHSFYSITILMCLFVVVSFLRLQVYPVHNIGLSPSQTSSISTSIFSTMPKQFVRLLNQPDPPNPLMDCYRPPPGKPEKARWVIPDIDYGLLGQFQSQKEKFKELEDINKILAKPRRAYKVRMEDITDEDYETNSKISVEERATMTKILNGTYAAQLDPPVEKLTARTLDKMTNQAYERKVVGMSVGGATVGGDLYNKIKSGSQTIEQMMSARSARTESSRSNQDHHHHQHSARMQQSNNNNNNRYSTTITFLVVSICSLYIVYTI